MVHMSSSEIKKHYVFFFFSKKDEQFYLRTTGSPFFSEALTGTTSTDTLRPNPEDTRHFDSASHPRYTCDFWFQVMKANSPMFQHLRTTRLETLYSDKIHCAEIMEVRKALAFAGFTHKSPRAVEYMRADGGFDNLPSMQHVAKDTVRGRPLVRETRIIGLGRAISM